MDTKSRKFDRTWVTKTIAFLLAVLLAAFASMYTLKQAVNLERDIDGAGVYVHDFLRGVNHSEVTKMQSFANENQNLQRCALEYALFGDGSKDAYKAYMQQYKAARSDDLSASQRKTILKNCAGESGNGSPAAIFSYMMENLVKMRKLSDHEQHYVQNMLIVDGAGLFEGVPTDDGDYEYEDQIYDFNSGDFYGEDFYRDEDGDDGYVTTVMEDVTNPQTFMSDSAYQSRNEQPKELYSQLGNDEILVELCHCRHMDGNNVYDGYYALSVNERMLDARNQNSRTNYQTAFASYESFKTAYADARQAAEAYKNMTFAVVNTDTGRIASNVADLDGKQADAKTLRSFTNSTWNYKIDLMTGNWSASVKATEDISDNPFLRQNMTWFLESGEVNATMYVSYDERQPKTDPFQNHLAAYLHVEEVLKTTLKVDLLCLLIILVCTVYLIIRAGRRHSDDELHMMRTDKIFTLLRTILNLGAAVGFGGIAFAVLEYFPDNGTGAELLMMIGIGGCAAAIAALLLDWLLYLTRHIKNGTLLKNFFVVWLFKKGKVLAEKIKAAHAARPQVVRDLLNDILRRVLLMGFLPNFILGLLIVILAGNQSFGAAICLIFLIFVYDVFLALYICWYAFHLRTVIEAVHSMREGDMNVQIDTTRMPKPVKVFADDVMELQRGLQIAVNNALKDERMRTELITNVSHDLKTPLTSIINYVDLLTRCDIPDETAQQYIAVLGEKSARLKKLIEDLVEASKASSGAIRVDLVDMSLGELTNQIVGEYDDAFTERNLELIYTAEQDVLVRADSKLCYRVLDNLMGNVKKYAMPGTRVYLDLTQTDTHGVLTLRNVSQSQLNIPVEELLERFVRADESRSTEGSGLGLSIADNLCRLQGAELRLSISGDLFTAEVAFPKA